MAPPAGFTIDPKTGERVPVQGAAGGLPPGVQIDPATGERMAAAPPPVAGAGPLGTPQPAAHPAITMQPSAFAPDYEHPGIAGALREVPADGSDTGGSKVAAAVQNFGSHAGSAILNPVMHPIDTMKGIAKMVTPDSGAAGLGEALLGPAGAPLVHMGQGIANDFKDGPGAGVPRLAGDVAGQFLAGELGGAGLAKIKAIPQMVRGTLAGDINAPIPGTSVTPAARYRSAQRLGVNLDAADATGSAALGNIKKIGENSFAGGPAYDANKAANTAALTNSTDDVLNNLYNGDRESGGAEIQRALQADHAGLRSGAEGGFDTLTRQTSGKPVVGAPAVGASASKLLSDIEPLAAKYPSMAPAKTLSVLRDLAKVGGQTPAPAPINFLDAPGSEFAQPRPVTPPAPDTWADLQRLRSATHDLTTTNPDLVKSQAVAPLQQMTSSLDDAMTNGASGLTPAQAAIFRDANAQWKDMKGTYDDPSSPLYHAVRTDTPSTLYGGVGSKTPEGVRDVMGRISPASGPQPSPALGALRRGTVEGALKTTNDGSPNFKTFGTQLNRIPADYRAELFSLPQNETLADIQHTSNVLGKDFNPSGSGKLVQKVGDISSLFTGAGVGAGEMLAGHPIAGAATMAAAPIYNAAQYGAARAMNSPAVVNWLMTPKPFQPFSPGGAAIATAAAAAARKKQAAK